MKPDPLASLSSRLKCSHPVTGRLSTRVQQLPATRRRPKRRQPRTRRRAQPSAAYVHLPSLSTAAHGLSSKPIHFSSSRIFAARLYSFAAALLFSPPHQREAVIAPPQATDHRVARAPPSSLSEAILKPQLQASPKQSPSFAPIDAEHHQHQPSTTILRASQRRRIVHLSSELLTDPANRASDPFPSPSPSVPAGQAMPPWNPPSW
jgi:hypothetical protein